VSREGDGGHLERVSRREQKRAEESRRENSVERSVCAFVKEVKVPHI